MPENMERELKNTATLTKIRIISNSLGLGLVGLKTVADIRTHRTHDEHHQRCQCFSQCFRCAVDGAKLVSRKK